MSRHLSDISNHMMEWIEMLKLYSLLRDAAEKMYDAIWSAYDSYRHKLDNGRVSFKEVAKKIDYASAEALRRFLESESIKYEVISEEWFEDYTPEDYSTTLIVDPIDGTSNFVRNIPFSAISIAAANGPNLKHVYAGIVLNLFTRDVYFAYSGKGAFKNGSRIKVSRVTDTRISHMAISITHAIPFKSPSLYILRYTNYPRSFGSAALEDCLVAEGKIDAHIDVRGDLRVFDIAASQLIVKEAGGKVIVRQFDNDRVLLKNIGGIKIVSAATPQLMERITEIIRWP